MRTNEFEKKLKTQLKLGETATSMCFRNIDGNYTLAVLCIEPSFTEEELVIKAVPAMIYWDNDAKEARREEIPFQMQKELDLPITVKTEDGATNEEDTKNYYINIEKICCALNVDCVTSSMKTEYRKIMGFDFDSGIEKIFWYFFPDAMKKLN